MSLDDYQHIDPKTIDNLCPGIHAVQLAVLREYLVIRLADIEQLAKALDEGTIECQRQYAHRMKSQFRLLGASAQAALCEQLEATPPPPISRRLFEQLRQKEQYMAAEVTRLVDELTPLTEA